MSHRSLELRPSSVESCTSQFLSWRPFQAATKTLDPYDSPKPCYNSTNGFHYPTKRPCPSDRATSLPIDAIDSSISRLSLADEDVSNNGFGASRGRQASSVSRYKRGSLRLLAKKRRRRGSRSVSGRSCCSVGAAHGTCSDFAALAIGGTDSSGELFGDASWASDVSEARREGSGEKENGGFGLGVGVGVDPMGNESGYGSEPGYRGDAEFGYDDEFDEEEEDSKLLFWGNQMEDADSAMEIVGETTFSDQKFHSRCRRKKHDNR